jgi:biotin-[acetyl-CoA-carboxylase] ligase BirA-like protein
MTIWLRSTTSTMKDAAALALRGQPHGTTVVAEQQTAGIGRHGHSWHSEAGGLYMSIILRPQLPPDALPVLTMALGIATQRAIEEVAGVKCDIRWPNDLLLDGKKVAGIIVQSAESALIAGIGINASQTAFPDDLRDIAASLDTDKGPLLDAVLAKSLEYTKLLEIEGKARILQEFETLSTYVRGKEVEVGAIQGTTAGLDENGFLRVQTATGIETILTGGVRERKIVIADYDPNWPEVYSREAERILGSLREVLRLEHIGSTSVPGLAAKPVIDILLEVENSADEHAYLTQLQSIGYHLKIREPNWHEHRMLVTPAILSPVPFVSVNLHIYSQHCPEITRVLLFRDWLRTNPADRELYATVKRELAKQQWKSVDAYAEAKTTVIEKIMQRAQQQSRSSIAG